MTPSEWHASAVQRDAGHDALQVELWTALHTRPDDYRIEHGRTEFQRYDVVFEYPFVRGNRIIGFADICEVWMPMNHNLPMVHLFAYEVKPKIESVGALVRQSRAIQQLAEVSQIGHRMIVPSVDLYAVVPHTDRKIEQLEEVFPGCVWPWEDGRPAVGARLLHAPWTRRVPTAPQIDGPSDVD